MSGFKWSNFSSSAVANGAITSFTVGSTNPAGSNGAIAQNDLLLAFVVVTTTTTPDAGIISVAGFTPWVQQTDDSADLPVSYYFGTKVAGPSETGNYTATWTNNSRGASWALLDYTGVNISAMIDPPGGGSSIFQNNNSFSVNMPAPRPTLIGISDTLIAMFSSTGTQAPYVGDPGMITRANVWATGVGSSDRPEILVAERALSGPGQIAQFTATQAAVDTSNTIAFGLMQAVADSLGTSIARLRSPDWGW